MQIKLTYKDKVYILEYPLKSIDAMENAGFKISQVSEFPSTGPYTLFAGAFREHHRTLPDIKIREIYDNLNGRLGLIEKLTEMYAAAINDLYEDKEDEPGNASWAVD